MPKMLDKYIRFRFFVAHFG